MWPFYTTELISKLYPHWSACYWVTFFTNKKNLNWSYLRYSEKLKHVLVWITTVQVHKWQIQCLFIFQALVLSGWICSAALIYAVVFGPFRLQQLTAPVEVVEDGIYKALGPLAWAIGVSWVIYACHFGYGGLVNSFLSFPIWQPCARLTYAIYLSHFVIQTVIAASTRTPVYFNTTTLVSGFPDNVKVGTYPSYQAVFQIFV